MRAKLVEQQEFERGQDPKRAMDIGIPPPSMDQIIDVLISGDASDEVWEGIERFVNEELLDRIYMKYPNADTQKVKDAIQIVIKEVLDTWEQTTMDEDEG